MDTIIAISEKDESRLVLSSVCSFDNSYIDFVEVECEKEIDKTLEDIVKELLKEIENHPDLDTEEKKIDYAIRMAFFKGVLKTTGN